MKEKEIWKDIPGYEGLYQISNNGGVKRMPKNTVTITGKIRIHKLKILKPSTDSRGYSQTCLFKLGIGKIVSVHRFVAITFIENTENKPQINHKDGNKKNNHVDNLEWCTNTENMQHAVRNKLMARGEENGISKLNELQVRVIKKTFGITQEEIAEYFCVHRSTISRIRSNTNWKHVK